MLGILSMSGFAIAAIVAGLCLLSILAGAVYVIGFMKPGTWGFLSGLFGGGGGASSPGAYAGSAAVSVPSASSAGAGSSVQQPQGQAAPVQTTTQTQAVPAAVPATAPAGGWKRAKNTYYNSYPSCCPESPNYDPSAGKSECQNYNGCKWAGQFAYGGKKSADYVKSNNIVSFFDLGAKGAGAMAGKQIRLRKNGKEIVATVLDTCGDSDCGGCCSTNARGTGYLVDVEANTCIRNFGGVSACSGEIEWAPL